MASESAAAGAHEALLAQQGVGERYVRLLCQFEPGAVLPFLQSHDAYRVEEVLPYTERFGVADAQVRGFAGCPAAHSAQSESSDVGAHPRPHAQAKSICMLPAEGQ